MFAALGFVEVGRTYPAASDEALDLGRTVTLVRKSVVDQNREPSGQHDG
jgi:hypothetical protein